MKVIPIRVVRMFVVLGVALYSPYHAWAQTSGSSDGAQTFDRSLQRVTQKLTQRTQRVEELGRENVSISAEIGQLREEQIAISVEVREQETAIITLGRRLEALRDLTDKVQARLRDNRKQYLHAIDLLRVFHGHPARNVVLYPGTALEYARAETLVRAAVPRLSQRVRDQHADMAELAILGSEIGARLAEMEWANQRLSERQGALKGILARKQHLLAANQKDLDASRQELEDLSRQATSLRGLVARLNALSSTSGASTEASASGSVPFTVPQTLALARPSAIRPFPKDRSLHLPVVGELVSSFGDSVSGGRTHGIVLLALEGAQAVAPFDGQVLFSGTFGNLGMVVIIGHAPQHHSVVQGLRQVHVRPGQWVFAGEPIGTAGGDGVTTWNPKTGRNGSHVYFEIRRNNTPIDPLRWLSSQPLLASR